MMCGCAVAICTGRPPCAVRDMWCIPRVDGEYVARMEDVLLRRIPIGPADLIPMEIWNRCGRCGRCGRSRPRGNCWMSRSHVPTELVVRLATTPVCREKERRYAVAFRSRRAIAIIGRRLEAKAVDS